jgi:predicted phage gp36 major capsid-like protein
MSVREQILAQHEELRVMFREVDEEATRIIRAERRMPSDLTGKLEASTVALRNHMEFEEQALTSGNAPHEDWGRDAAKQLAEEHARQREELARITRAANGADDLISLALMIRAFVADVGLDMQLEERRFLSPAALGRIQ